MKKSKGENSSTEKSNDGGRIDRKNIVRVYFVPGILHPKIYSKKLRGNIKRDLDIGSHKKVKITFFDDIFYTHFEYKKERRIISSITSDLEKDYKYIIKNNKKILIFSHSWGGILAKTAIAEFLAKVRDNLPIEEYKNLQNRIVLITMATPHAMIYGRAGAAKNKLATPDNVPQIKIFTWGGIFDIVVPAKFACIKNNRKNIQRGFSKKIKATHMMFLFSTKVHQAIFNDIFK